MKKTLASIIIGCGLIIAAIAIIALLSGTPQNPPVLQEPAWDSPQTRQLAQRACFDCHSNETIWPWYSRVIPFSWLIRHDVIDGRRRLNFSEWGSQRRETREMGEKVVEGEMPPFYYVMIHPTAKLSQTEQTALVQGLNALK